MKNILKFDGINDHHAAVFATELDFLSGQFYVFEMPTEKWEEMGRPGTVEVSVEVRK